MAVSFDCFFLEMSDIDVIYFRMIWAEFMPIFYLTVFLLVYLIVCLVKPNYYNKSVLYTTFIYMFIYLQPTLLGG